MIQITDLDAYHRRASAAGRRRREPGSVLQRRRVMAREDLFHLNADISVTADLRDVACEPCYRRVVASYLVVVV
jgi:hypothetical protein